MSNAVLNFFQKLTLKKVIKFVLNYATYLFFLLICLILAFTTTSFLTVNNIINVLLQTSIIAILAIGVTFVIITGANDLSMGTVMAIASAVGVGSVKILGGPWWIGMLLTLFVAIVFGILNGYIVAYLEVPAFLTTLSTKFIAKGLTLVVSKGVSWFGLPVSYGFIATARPLGVPFIIIVVVVLYFLFHFNLKHTIFGRRIFAIGSSRESARVSGINVRFNQLLAYVQCGFLVGIASILLAARMDSFWASMGTDLEFNAIAGTIIGGTSMHGGVGSLVGTFMGVMLMGVINNALNLYGVDANWQEAARGFVILFAVIIDALRNHFNTTD
jgi:ribose/xylose/arabinose/galactoside ABC-type transport system permease subunit